MKQPVVELGVVRVGARAQIGADGADGSWALAGAPDGKDAFASLHSRFPIVVEQHRPVIDSAGAGRWRGGLGVELILRASADLALRLAIEQAGDSSRGSANGLDGVHTSAWQLRDGMIRFYLSTEGAVNAELKRDDQIVIRSAGGGGYALPLERPPQEVARDVREQRVSAQAALFYYGVTIDAQTLELDVAATMKHRAMLLQAMRLPADARDPLVTAITEDAMARNHPDRALMFCMSPGCCMPRIPFLSGGTQSTPLP